MPRPTLILRADRYHGAVLGLPGRSVVISNSERNLLACQRKYLLSQIEGLRPKARSYPKSYGIAFHEFREVVNRAWIADRAPRPDEVAAIGEKVRRDLIEDQVAQRLDAETANDLYDSLTAGVEAWTWATGGGQPPQGYRLVATEVALAMPIRLLTGAPYAPDTRLTRIGTGLYRISIPGDTKARGAAITARIPWYFLGKLDMLFVHRASGTVWVADDKTSAQPEALARKVYNDPQVLSYLALVRYAVRAGLLVGYGIPKDAPIGGFWHRITSNAGYSQPKQLKTTTLKNGTVKGGGLSVARNQRIPSYRFEAKIRELGLDRGDYADFLSHLRTHVDPFIERNEFVGYANDEIDRFERELLGDAQRAHESWRKAWSAKHQEDLDVTHPRTRICQLPGGHCEYVGPCMRDGALARADYDVAPRATWTALTAQRRAALPGEGQLALTPGSASPPATQDPEPDAGADVGF